MAKHISQPDVFLGHSTPFPIKGAKRLRKDAARRKDPMISASAWLKLRVKGK